MQTVNEEPLSASAEKGAGCLLEQGGTGDCPLFHALLDGAPLDAF